MRRKDFSRVRRLNSIKNLIPLGFLLLSLIIPLSVCAAQAGPAGTSISYKVAPSAQITKISYYLGDFQGINTLFFEVSVKNISRDAKRFKLTVFVEDGPSAAYYYPRVGDPPVIKPGESFMEPLPVVVFEKLPLGFIIQVEEM